ncbi:MAG TPA: hypothetical protein PLQ19_09570 [Aeromicrobium sp.]|nr:hypothetical protein [Aeromicrobium sp.]
MVSQRVYGPADLSALRSLLAGHAVELAVVVPTSEDEQDEYDALVEAAELGPVVVTAEVAAIDVSIRPEDVQSFHLDADDSGDLAWYAPQELDQVIAILEGTKSAD